MPPIENHKPGSFCWIELSTIDQNAAKAFYSSLFGWTIKDEPNGPDSVYTSFHIGDRKIGAACTMGSELQAAKVPSHWKLYVAVENADATTERVAGAGGVVLAPAFDVMDLGRMAVIRDPTGAVIYIWQAQTRPGFQLTGEPGTQCWADLSTPNSSVARQFYSYVFGWKLVEDRNTGYLRIQNGGQFIGGMPPVHAKNARVPAHWLSYLMVSDCDATAAKAYDLEGTIFLEPTTIEDVGRVAILADPQGAAFGIYQPIKKA